MLTERDRSLVESLPWDSDASPAYDELGGFLVWSDEMPSGLTPAGHEYVRELLIIRSYLHRERPLEAVGPAGGFDQWNEALVGGLRWNGFERIALSEPDRAFLEESLASEP